MDTLIDPRPAAAGAENAAAPLPGADAFELVRALVRDNTRFEPEQLRQSAGADRRQPMTLAVDYTLTARLEHYFVNGHNFTARPGDVRVDLVHTVADDARREADERLALAHGMLREQLSSSATAHDRIGDGVYLGHQRRHWHLHRCAPCSGHGRVSCHTCDGHRQEACDCCGGDARVTCVVCSGTGRTWCGRCSNSGMLSQPDGHGGLAHYPCGCGGGRCGACGGARLMPCTECAATGRIRCRTCDGGGALRCDPCYGSGLYGESAWIEVDVAVAATMAVPDDASGEARAIAVKPAMELAAAADSIAPGAVTVLDGARLRAEYPLLLRLVHLDVACQTDNYQLVAYGRPLAWLTLDDIVEDLLRNDLHVLQHALAQDARGDALLEPLRALAASEMNADVIESLLDGGARAHLTTVSAVYGREVREAFLGALTRIYDQQGKRRWWHGALAAGAATLGVWSHWTLAWAVPAGLLASYACLLLFRRRLRALLSTALGGERQARRAITLAVRDRRQRTATRLVVLPALLVVCALAWQLPWDGWWSKHGGKARAEYGVGAYLR